MREVLERLAAAGFAGHVVVEINTRRALDRAEREADLAEALAFCRLHLMHALTGRGARGRSVPAWKTRRRPDGIAGLACDAAMLRHPPAGSCCCARARNDAASRAWSPTPRCPARSCVASSAARTPTPPSRSPGRSVADGRTVTLDHLGEDTTDRAQADAATAAYLDLLQALSEQDLTARLGLLTARAEVSVKLSAVGQSLGADGEHIAFDNARTICVEARRVGATVTLDAEDHTTTDSTLRVLGRLRAEFPETGAVLQAYLRRTESDCRELAHAGSRVRLCKGAYAEPESVAYQDRADVDRSYVRCANVLLAGGGYPMFATHDPTIIDILGARVAAHGRSAADVEYQMLYGIRPDEQKRLAAAGQHRARVRALRRPVVRLPDAPPRRAPGEPGILRPRAGVQGVTMTEQNTKIAILGGGKIGEALLSGLLRGQHGAADIVVTEKYAERAAYLRDTYGIRVISVAEALEHASTVILAVKPQDIDALLADLAAGTGPQHLIVSVAAGVPTAHIERALPDGVAVVRCMPNTPALVDEAMTAVAGGAHASDEHLERRGRPARDRGPGGAGAGVPARRRHRTVRLRARILLLPRRGDDRRRHPARPAPGAVGGADRADRRRRGDDAARLRGTPGAAARGRHQPGRHDDRRHPRARGARRTGGVAGRDRGRGAAQQGTRRRRLTR